MRRLVLTLSPTLRWRSARKWPGPSVLRSDSRCVAPPRCSGRLERARCKENNQEDSSLHSTTTFPSSSLLPLPFRFSCAPALLGVPPVSPLSDDDLRLQADCACWAGRSAAEGGGRSDHLVCADFAVEIAAHPCPTTLPPGLQGCPRHSVRLLITSHGDPVATLPPAHYVGGGWGRLGGGKTGEKREARSKERSFLHTAGGGVGLGVWLGGCSGSR